MSIFISPVNIVVGAGTIQQVPQFIEQLKGSKVFIIADPGLVQIGLVNSLTDVLDEKKITYSIFSNIQPEPPVEVADNTIAALRESGADIVIGIGGGSALDITKTAAVLVTHEGTTQDYLNLLGTKKLQHKGLPFILIPTTSGTGSEVTNNAVFSLENSKDVIADPLLMADVAIVDPELTYTLPASITAATGVDALTHALEAYISIYATPLTDGLALQSIRLIGKSIRTAVWNGKDVQARTDMSWGSLIAGLSFYNAGVSGVHALAYPLGGMYHLPHGVCNAVMLPYVFDYIWPSCMDKVATIASELGVDTTNLSTRSAAIEGVKAMRDIVIDTGIPLTLKELGIDKKDLDALASAALEQQRLLARSPKPYKLEDIRAIYQAAYDGVLQVEKVLVHSR